MNFLVRNYHDEHSYHYIGSALKLGNSTVKRHCSVLWNLNLINRSATNIIDEKYYYHWKANITNEVTKVVMAELEVLIKEEIIE